MQVPHDHRKPIGHRIVRLATTESTMDDARHLVDRNGSRHSHGVVVTAREQTQGKGTRGRQWHTDPDRTLPITIIVTPEPAIPRPALLTLATAAALVDAGEHVGAELLIRWPNDVVDLSGRKVAGILAHAVDAEPACFLIGIGVNVLPADIQDPSLSDPIGSLQESGGDVHRAEDWLPTLLCSVSGRLNQLSSTGPGPLRDRFQEKSFLSTTVDRYRRGNEVVTGTLTGLTPDLNLELRAMNGQRVTWPSEQVVRLRSGEPDPSG